MASTMLDLPHPFGPMMQLSPVPLKVKWVFSQKDLKPTSSTLRSLSKVTPSPSVTPAATKEHALADTYSVSSRGGEWRQKLWRVAKQWPSRLALGSAVTGSDHSTRADGCKGLLAPIINRLG